MTIAQKAEQEAIGKGVGDIQIKQLTDAKEGYDNASTAQFKIGELMHNLSSLPQAGLLAPGAYATERVGMAKSINTAMAAFKLSPAFDQNAISGAESAQKITGGLGFDMSRTLGSREAAQIVNQAIKLNPGIENTPQGARTVSAAINAGLQRQKDFYSFLAETGNPKGGDILFNKIHPPAQYVKEAQVLAKAPQSDVELLQAHADNPAAAAAFDQKYGPGMSRYFTGQ